MTYSSVFGGATLYPSDQTLVKLTLTSDVTLSWPIEQQVGGDNIVADIIEFIASTSGLSLIFPDATRSSNGIQTALVNKGSNTVTIKNSTGGTILTVAAGEAWILYLSDNSTAAGTWSSFQIGATTSVANAAALAGAGLVAISTTLNQSMPTNTQSTSPLTIVNSNRAQIIIWVGGTATINLPDPAVVGSNWFFMLRNSGSGSATVTAVSGLVDGSTTLIVGTGESTILFTDGTDFFTLGFGRSNLSIFDFISIDITGTGDYVLSGAELNRISYRFVGTLSGNRKVVVPNTIQQYWVDNSTTGAFTFSVATSAQVTPVVIAQGDRNILYCDSLNVYLADSAQISFPLAVSLGGTGATTAAGARTNLSVPPTTRLLTAGIGIAGGGDLSADRTFDLEQATEIALGGAELATLTEVQTGTDALRIVTPVNLKATVPYLSTHNTFTGQQTLSNTSPALDFYETDGALDNKRWRAIASAEVFSWQLRDDADTSGSSFMRVNRTGTTIDSVDFPVSLQRGGVETAILTTNIFTGSQEIQGLLHLTNVAAGIYMDSVGNSGTGTKKITCNDGSGNWNLRSGCYASGVNLLYETTGDGAANIIFNHEVTNGSITLNTSPTGTAGAIVTVDTSLSITGGVVNVTSGVLRQAGVNVATVNDLVFRGAEAFLNGGVTLTIGTVFSVNSTNISGFNEEYDPQSIYVPTTGIYTPTKAGYYLCSMHAYVTGLAVGITSYIYVNGFIISQGYVEGTAGTVANQKLVYMNGTTDYIEFKLFSNDTSWNIFRLNTAVIYQGTP